MAKKGLTVCTLNHFTASLENIFLIGCLPNHLTPFHIIGFQYMIWIMLSVCSFHILLVSFV